jgi:SAM-dependent MidA family methyltransferase
MSGLDDLLADRIARFGSLRFDEFVDLALNAPDGGFFASGGTAGRREGDFITSPEVGPLFGAVVARYLDARWEDLGFPDPFVVVEAGAGRGALALAVLAAAPRCAHALRYVLVESSPALRQAQAEHLALVHPFEVLGPEADPDAGLPAPDAGAGPLVCALEDLPVQRVDGVVLANELLDNLPFRLLERADDGWSEVRVALDAGRLVELLVPADAAVSERAEALAPDAPVGGRIPMQDAAGEWLRRGMAVLQAGSVVVVDYAASTTASLADRPPGEWLRTYRSHVRGGPPLERPGTQDVTCEVAVDQLARVATPDAERSQADWLRHWGIEALVADGRRIWEERAGVGDLAALRARSRTVEAEALVDPTGLGAFRVVEWRVG